MLRAFVLGALLSALLPNFGTTSLFANDPGGGGDRSEGVVEFSETPTTATLANGRITAVIEKASGRVKSLVFDGTETVEARSPIYYSMDGGDLYEQPGRGVFSVVSREGGQVHVRTKQTWTGARGQKHPFDIELNWILRAGDTGLYGYNVLEHPASYPDAGIGEWRIVWKLPRTRDAWVFGRNYVDEARHWDMPPLSDFQKASPTPIAEIFKLNTGPWAGHMDGKYSYAARYFEIGTWGQTSASTGKGVWFVLGGHDYFNSGPTHQDLTSSESYILMHFGRNHFGGAGINVKSGERWRKQFGPYLLYCNGGEGKQGDALWADARAQVAAEQRAWPYAWLTTADYPALAARGSVSGTVLISDKLKPSVGGAGAYVGLVDATEAGGNWQRQAKGYQYWTRAAADGTFSIPAVRPGRYALRVFNRGVVGEFSQGDVEASPGADTALGTVRWDVENPGATLAWEIGVPDRTAAEFFNGDRHWVPFIWEQFSKQLPNPLVFRVGVADPAKDWNYVHMGYRTEDPTTGEVRYRQWDWNVVFELKDVPKSAHAVLTVAYASAKQPHAWVHLNGSQRPLARLAPTGDAGNAVLRQGNFAKYSYERIKIPVSQLRRGENTLTFRYGGGQGASEHVMYDYISLHLPVEPSAPSGLRVAP